MDESCMLANYEYVSVKNSFAIDVLRKVKAEIREAYPYFDSADVHWGFNICIDIIDKHISELKGENK